MRTRSTIHHSLHGQLTNEVQNGVTIARTYDALNRPTGYSLMQNGGGGNPVEVSYTYDNLGLFSGVCFNAEAQRGRVDFEYSYLPGTDLVSGYTATKTSPQSGGNLGGSAAQTSPRSGINLLTRSVAYEPHRDLISSITNSFNSSTPNSSTHQLFFTTYDANGNISEYVSTNGEIVAHYDYSPFGETLIESGDLASTFTHRFSTKPWCPVTGLYEYQMRKYRPGIGRWLSRDTSQLNKKFLYGCCNNNPVQHYDYLGNDVDYDIQSYGEVSKERLANMYKIHASAVKFPATKLHGIFLISPRFEGVDCIAKNSIQYEVREKTTPSVIATGLIAWEENNAAAGEHEYRHYASNFVNLNALSDEIQKYVGKIVCEKKCICIIRYLEAFRDYIFAKAELDDSRIDFEDYPHDLKEQANQIYGEAYGVFFAAEEVMLNARKEMESTP